MLFPHYFSHFHPISIRFPSHLIYVPKFIRIDDVAEGKLSAEQAKGVLEKGKELGVIKELLNRPDARQSAQVQQAKTFSAGVGTNEAGSQEFNRGTAV